MAATSKINTVDTIIIVRRWCKGRDGRMVVDQKVYCGQKQIYSIRMPFDMWMEQKQEPIRDFELKILGRNEGQRAQHVRGNGGKLGSLLRKVRRKLFGQ